MRSTPRDAKAASPSPDCNLTPLRQPARSETPLGTREPFIPLPEEVPRPNSSAGFNKVRASRNASTPVNGARQDRRFWPRDTRGLLELCEQGYVLQQGMKTHCQETAEMLETLNETCETTANSFLEQMQKTLCMIQAQCEKPAQIDWSPIFDRLDKMQPELVERVVADHQTTTQRLEYQMEARFAQALEELHASKQRDEAQLQEVRRELRVGTVAVEEMSQAHVRLERMVLEQSQEQSAQLQKSVCDASQVHGSITAHLCSIEPMIQMQTKNAMEADSRNHTLVTEIHHTVREDILGLFPEIGHIQRALNLPYVAKHPKSKGRKDDAVRMRDMHAQTENLISDCWTQTEDGFFGDVGKKSKKKKQHHQIVVGAPRQPARHDTVTKSKKQMFADEDVMKAQMREALIRPEYNVLEMYHASGFFQGVAKSYVFEHLTFSVILANALWISVDTDYNDAQFLYNAHPVFQVTENAFCAYFSLELFIRCMAFEYTRNCLKDFWFVFDAILVGTMVIETWILTAVVYSMDSEGMASGMGNLSMFRIVRLAKILRMARLARLLRMVPELVVIIRGIGIAFRSVSFFILLVAIIVYVFAVGFTQVTKGSDIGQRYFPTVRDAMNFLILHGMLPLYAGMVEDISRENPLYYPAIMIFILLASITVMNMLIGVLVEVVRTVAATEKEGMTVTHVTQQLGEVMAQFQNGPDEVKNEGVMQRMKRASTAAPTAFEMQKSFSGKLLRADFEKFLMQPEVAVIIQDVGVDVVGLIDMADLIYEEKDKLGMGLTFEDFVHIVLNMRGTNPATVKDVKQQIRVMKNAMKENAHVLRQHIVDDMDNFRMDVMEQLVEIRRGQLGSDAGSDVEEGEPPMRGVTLGRGFTNEAQQFHIPTRGLLDGDLDQDEHVEEFEDMDDMDRMGSAQSGTEPSV